MIKFPKSKLLSFGILIIAFVYSCKTDKIVNSKILNETETALTSSNNIIALQSKSHYKNLQENLNNPSFQSKAEYWYPKALSLKSFTDIAISKLDSLKYYIVSKEKSSIAENIFETIKLYQENLTKLDPTLTIEFRQDIDHLNTDTNKSFFTSQLSQNITKAELPLMITKIQNDINLLEFKLSEFCLNQSKPGCILGFDTFSAIVSQNAKHLKEGEVLEIVAGVGSFTNAAMPNITIAHEQIGINDEGVSRYATKVSGTGKKNIPVSIEYKDNDGVKRLKLYSIDYYIDK